MVRSEIISKLSDKIHRKIKKSELEKILDIVLKTIIDGIRNNHNCELRKFGTFAPKKIKARLNARNPRTGEKIHAKEKISIAFKMSEELKNQINNKEGDIN